MGTTLSNVAVVVNKDNMFFVKCKDLTTEYKLPRVKTDEAITRWRTDPMTFYQNQFNFAVYCASTACGVGQDLFNNKNQYISALFNFHLYFTIRKILYNLVAPIPGDDVFNALNNRYDKRAFTDTCRVFGIDQSKSFKQTRDTTSNGLGTAYYYNSGYVPVPGKNYDPHDLGVNYGTYAGATYMGFGLTDPPKGSGHASTYTVTWLEQSKDVLTGWSDFIPKTSSFTEVGITKINESIRAYVYALLGAQAQTKTSVLTPGTGLDAQHQFVTIVESLINSEPDLEQSINQFQDSLQYAKTPLNFVVRPGLYLIPSDMDLRVGVHDGYNNNLQIAPLNAKAGFQPTLNAPVQVEDFNPEPSFEPETPTQEQTTPPQTPTLPPVVPTLPPPKSPASSPKASLDIHNEEKLSLTIGIVAIVAMGFLAYEILT